MKRIDPGKLEYTDEIITGAEQPGEVLMGIVFTQCTFKGCNFQESEFINCRFVDCTFEGCNLSLITLTDCTFRDVLFQGTQAVGIDWTKARWDKRGILNSVNFVESVLNYGLFFGLVLKKIRIENCVARGADFSDADLSKAVLKDTDFADARFHNTDLREVDLRGARSYAISPGHNPIKGAKFSLPEAVSLLYGLEIEIEK